MTSHQPASERLTLQDRNREVHVQKVYTKKGERLEIDAVDDDQCVYLDALLLESVSWQRHDTVLADIIDTDSTAGEDDLTSPDGPEPLDQDGETITVTNEFAEVSIRKVATSAGDRLEIAAPKMDFEVLLHATSLGRLAAQDTQNTLTKLLETPYGPE